MMQYLHTVEIQNLLLAMLIDFDRMTNEHGLRYSLDGGTLLGAVRHRGFIPWDNDSILMKNERRLVSKDSNQANSWEVGVSNYWGNQLFQRLLKSKELGQ